MEQPMFFNGKKVAEEKRQWDRFDFFQATFCKFINDQQEEILTKCFLKNISHGGLSFYLKDEMLKVNSKVQVLYKIGTKTRYDFIFIKSGSKFLGDWRYGGQFAGLDKERDFLIQNKVAAKVEKSPV
jgi:hypothetical protein